ncbi:uncharacterized protein LOC110983377 [Acanthaster planci]|uniref:Uncharacterized protein LOC110983377 n=1 Tax=Acanthaster planci TaxID=133434 RepID=A0A8B7Z4L1_ACAPL|nr:uncharacterized protein LOC110983377 [Acanthaster planci]
MDECTRLLKAYLGFMGKLSAVGIGTYNVQEDHLTAETKTWRGTCCVTLQYRSTMVTCGHAFSIPPDMAGLFVYLLAVGVICSGPSAQEVIDQPTDREGMPEGADRACGASQYTVLPDDPRRSVGFSAIRLDLSRLISDHALTGGWYRFSDVPGKWI